MGFVDAKNEMTFGKKISDVKGAVKSTISHFGWKIIDEKGNTLECSRPTGLIIGSNIMISLKSVGNKTNVEINVRSKLGALGMLGGNLQSRLYVKQFFDELSKRVAAL